MQRPRLRFVLLVALASGLGCGARSDETDELGSVRAAVVGNPQLSTSAEDFVLFVNHIGSAGTDNAYNGCSATLVAPNLVMTAKHCVNYYAPGESLCDATGEPQVGSTGGYTTGGVLPSEITFYTGVTARARADQGAPPDAVAVKYFDDGTQTLCSHDLAYVLLDRPITSAPIGKLRLGRRPQQGDALALAGWGFIDDRIRTTSRYLRNDLVVRRVGPAVVAPNPTGSLGPRSLETGPAACSGDSGSPGFDPASGVVFGVIARAGPLDNSNGSGSMATSA